MKSKFVYILVFLLGIVVAAISYCFIKDKVEYNINIINLLRLLVTSILTIYVVYLGNSINKKNTSCDVICKDLMELCDVYNKNITILENLIKKNIEISEARSDINMTFHRGDIIVDSINKEIEESFPKFDLKKNDLGKTTEGYWKWLTGGCLFEDDFKISKEFLKQHENELRKTILGIKLIIHRLIKDS